MSLASMIRSNNQIAKYLHHYSKFTTPSQSEKREEQAVKEEIAFGNAHHFFLN